MSDIYLSLTETPTVVTLSQPVVSGVLSSNVTVTNVVSVNVVTMPAITVQAAAPAVTTVAGTVSVSNFPSTQTIAGTVTANPPTYNLSLNTVTAFTFASSGDSPVFSVSQDVGNTWGFSGFFNAGTNNVYKLQEVLGQGGAGGLDVTLHRASDSNITVTTFSNAGPLIVKSGTLPYDNNPNQGDVKYFKFVKVSGTAGSNITASVFKASISNYGFPQSIAGAVTASISNSVTIGSLPAISGTVTVSALKDQIEEALFGTDQLVNNLNTGLLLTENVPISGTVTANNPSGALTTRFGSVTTANTAQITSAVTNTSRKYLLAQNISAGTVTIGIGFSPTTTQGIQLTAGGGLTFDAFCPTGAVYWLGAVTGAAYTILEG